MKKGRVSLSIGLVLLVAALLLTALGIMNGLGLLPSFVSDVLARISFYVGLLPNEYGTFHVGMFLLLISVVVLSFRQRKPYSMFLPFFLAGGYFTLEIFLRLCNGIYVPEELFTSLRTQKLAIPLMLFLLVIEFALMVVLLVATGKADASWRRKRDLTRMKLEDEGVLESEEDVRAKKEKARLDKDRKVEDARNEKENKKIRAQLTKEERKEQKKQAKIAKKQQREYEREREALERKKELQDAKCARIAQKEKDKKDYLEAVENDKLQALQKKEEKRRKKDEKRLEKEMRKQVEIESLDVAVESPLANPNKPLEFPDLPDVSSMPRFQGVADVESDIPSRPAIDDSDYVEREERPLSSYSIALPEEDNKVDLNTKHYKAGGMLEATLEMMATIDDEEDEVVVNNNRIIGFDDEDRTEVCAPVSQSSIAPSTLPQSHPRYKMFESLAEAPAAPAVQPPVQKNRGNKKIAPSNLSPSHPRYKMFEALQNNTSSSVVSSYPSRAFEPEQESSPTTGSNLGVYQDIYQQQEDYERRRQEEEERRIEQARRDEELRLEREKLEAAERQRFERERMLRAQESARTMAIRKEPEHESDNDDVDEEPLDESVIPEQTESLDLTVGIGGLTSNNAGYKSIMRRGKRNYTAPPVSLLKDYPGLSSEIDPKTRTMGEVIVETYAQQRTMVQLSSIIKGPTVTMYELTLEPGTLISRITSRENELSYALGGKHIRILAPIPGKQAVGVEVPNDSTSIVGFKDMIYALRANEKLKSLKVPMILGRTIMGEPIVIDVAKMPHMIIAGTTGSGKSVCINAFINTLIYQKSPSEVRLVLVDPKVVELSLYNGIPHLLTPVITEAKKVVKILNFLVEEMERRYTMLAHLGVRNIIGYNQKLEDEHIAAEKMPYIVLIMDEFADMMSVVGKDIEIQIGRLAAKARAAGIHMILATQRPSSDVITGTIKSNLPARIAFAVSSSVNSRVILDEGGAENLLGKGDMLLMDPSKMGLQRIQGAFLSDGEVDSVVDFTKSHGGDPDYLDDVIFEDNDKPSSSDDMGDGPIGDEDSDEYLFEQAKQIAYEKKTVSASFLQRRMRIGYNRAARLIEMMEEKGIIGPPNGSKPREVIKFE